MSYLKARAVIPARSVRVRSRSQASFEPLERRALLSAASASFVVHVSVDGLRPDAVTALGAAQLPNFYRLRTEGAFTDNARTDYDYTITLPNHTDQVTGRPVVGRSALGVDGHNWVVNTDPAAGQTIHSNKGSYVPSAWDVAHDNGLRTALYASKTKFSLYDASYDADTTDLQGGAPDVTGEDNGRDKIDTYDYQADSAVLTDRFVAAMTSAPFNYAMVHYHDPDTAGHASGWMSSAYLDAVKKVDAELGKILDLVQTGAALSGRTAVVLTADHGGNGTDHSANSDRLDYTIPFYVLGPGVPAAADLYALNRAIRANPGTGRPNYDVTQPVRNGDVANLVADFLGLPAVGGSFFNASQDLRVTNTAPAAQDDAGATDEDVALTVDVLANDADADGDALSVVVETNPAHGALARSPDGRTLTYQPEPNFSGTDSFSYKASDGVVDSNVATVTVTVNPVEDAPVAREDAYPVAHDTELTVAAPGVLANDTDAEGAPLNAALASGPSNGTVALNIDGSFVYTPAPGFAGTDQFTYTVSDGALTSTPATVAITVTPANRAPVAAAENYTIGEDATLTVAAPGVLGNDADPDGDPVSAVLVTPTAHGTLALNADGSFTYRPAANYFGPDSFTYRASDGAAESADVTVNLTVNAVFTAPANLSGSAVSGGASGSVRLTWQDRSDDETNFVIQISTDGVNWDRIPAVTVGADTTSHAVSGLSRNAFYYFRVYAVDASGAPSGYTNVVKVRTSKK